MTDLLSIVSGWTGELGPFTLRVDGVPLNLTGLTVVPVLHDYAGVLIDHGGTVTVLNQTTNPGQVTYTPVATDFVFNSAGPTYRQAVSIRWKVTDVNNKMVFFPNKDLDYIGVYSS
jgi:hypothetical protein